MKKKERVISHQIMKSGTSIGANISEATYAQSKKDFVSKMSVALKEANETKYWIELLEGEYISKKEADSLLGDVMEILKMLISIVKNSKETMLLLRRQDFKGLKACFGTRFSYAPVMLLAWISLGLQQKLIDFN